MRKKKYSKNSVRKIPWHDKIAYFILNCCKPRSKQLQEIRSRIVDLTKDSPCYELSTEASVLLGLLEKDFSNVTACSAQTILSHIENTGVSLPKDTAARQVVRVRRLLKKEEVAKELHSIA